MDETKKYRVTFLKEGGGYDERFADSIFALKIAMKDMSTLKDCTLYNTATDFFESVDGVKTILHGPDDVVKSYSTVGDFLDDSNI